MKTALTPRSLSLARFDDATAAAGSWHPQVSSPHLAALRRLVPVWMGPDALHTAPQTAAAPPAAAADPAFDQAWPTREHRVHRGTGRILSRGDRSAGRCVTAMAPGDGGIQAQVTDPGAEAVSALLYREVLGRTP